MENEIMQQPVWSMFQLMKAEDFKMVAEALKKAASETLGRDRSILEDCSQTFLHMSQNV